jgi:trigger factor
MKTSLENISPVKKKLSVEIDSEEVDSRFNEAFRRLGKQIKMPGFRPGKVPRKILERHIGDQVAEDVAKDIINETLPEALQENETFPLGAPFLEKETLKQGHNFKYSAVMEVRPRFELENYMGIELEKEVYSVTDQDVQKQLEEIREAHGTLVSIDSDRPIQKDDHAVIDYEGFESGQPLDGIRASNFLLKVGSNNFHPKFEESLIGLKKEDEVEIETDFEESYPHEKLAGKKVNFTVRIADIKKMDLPEVNDEFARNLGADFKNLEELKEKVREAFSAQEEKRIDRQLKQQLLKKISDTVEFEIPQTLVESETDFAVESVKQNLVRSGSNLQKAGISEEKLRNDFRPASEKRVKDLLILGEISKQNEITVEEEDLAKEFDELAATTGQDAVALRQYYQAKNLIGPLKEKVLEEKTLNYLIENANISLRNDLELKKAATQENS